MDLPPGRSREAEAKGESAAATQRLTFDPDAAAAHRSHHKRSGT